MPQNLTDTSTFTAPVVAVADGDAVDAALTNTAPQALANRTRMLLDRALGGVASWPRTGVIRKVSCVGSAFTGAGSSVIVSGGSIFAKLADNSAQMIKELNPILVSGMTLEQVDIVINTADASATARVDVVYQAHNYATPASEPITYSGVGLGKAAAASAGKQRVFQGGGTHVVDLTANDYYMIVQGNTTAGTPGNADYLYAAQIYLTDPGGPRV